MTTMMQFQKVKHGEVVLHNGKQARYDHSCRTFRELNALRPANWRSDFLAMHGCLALVGTDILRAVHAGGTTVWTKYYPEQNTHGHIADGHTPIGVTKGYIFDFSRRAYVPPVLHIPAHWDTPCYPNDCHRTCSLDGHDEIYYSKADNMWRLLFHSNEPSNIKEFNGINRQYNNALKEEQTKGEEVMDMKDFLMFSMMSGGQQGTNSQSGFNPMMMLMLMDDKKGSKDLLPLMLLSQGTAGGNSNSMQQFMMMSMMSDDKDPETAAMMKNAMLIQMFPDATDVEKSLLAQGRIKTFLTMRFPSFGGGGQLVPAEQK
jgi:hypothetical protein